MSEAVKLYKDGCEFWAPAADVERLKADGWSEKRPKNAPKVILKGKGVK